MSGYVNYNIGMEPDVSGWMDEKAEISKSLVAGGLEGAFAPWRRLLEGWI